MSVNPSEPQDRGIGSIAHLFLSQSGREQVAAKRQGPQAAGPEKDDDAGREEREFEQIGDGPGQVERELGRSRPGRDSGDVDKQLSDPSQARPQQADGRAGRSAPVPQPQFPTADDKSSQTSQGRFYSTIEEALSRLMAQVTTGPEQDVLDSPEDQDVLPQAKAPPTAQNRQKLTFLALPSHLAHPRRELQRYARQLAFHEGRVLWLDLDGSETQLVQVATDDKIDPDASSDLPTVLSDQINKAQILLIGSVEPRSEHLPRLIKHCREVVLLCECSPEGIVAAYKNIKWLKDLITPNQWISIYLCQEDEDKAVNFYKKLSETARQYLQIDLEWAGCYEKAGNLGAGKVITVAPTSKIVDELIGLLARSEINNQPTQPKETVRIKGPEVMKTIEEIVAPKKPLTSHQTVAPTNPAPLCPIPVEKLPRDNAALSDALQLALPGWLTELPSVMAMPLNLPDTIDRSVRVLIDATGHLYILATSLTDDVGLWQKALQGRKWLIENISLIVSHCRQLKIDPSQEAGIVLVTAGADSLRQNCDQISDFPCLILQLHLLQNGPNKSLLIV